MKLAVLSDIHGNIRALNAVIRDLERREVDHVVNLGDCLYGPFDPRPVAQCLMARQWPTVAGNEDRILGEMLEDRLLSRTAGWIRSQLSLKQMTWISDLPGVLALTEDVVCFHGQPVCDTSYLFTHVDESGAVSQRSIQEIEQALAGIGHSLVLCGHDHTASHCQPSRRQDSRESGQRGVFGLQG
jgi:predicted phosphodiesterase